MSNTFVEVHSLTKKGRTRITSSSSQDKAGAIIYITNPNNALLNIYQERFFSKIYQTVALFDFPLKRDN